MGSPASKSPSTGMGALRQRLRRPLDRLFTAPLLRFLVAARLSPNRITVLGMAVALGAAALLATGQHIAGGALVLVAALFDLLDGALARATNRASIRGALLDSTLDRLSEGAILGGLLIHSARDDGSGEVLAIAAVLLASFMVSYIKARAEGLGLSCNVGLFTRPERVLFIALAALTGQVTILLSIAAALSSLTALHRFAHAWRAARGG